MKNAKDFINMYNSLPIEARSELIIFTEPNNMYSLSVIHSEVIRKTKLGKKLLKELGYKR